MSINNQIMKIRMFGGFEALYGNRAVIVMGSYNGKAVQLFQYLLLRRDRKISRSELENAIVGSEEYDNPASIVKNLVYRLRKIFIDAGISEQIVTYSKSCYGISDKIEFDIDTERFVECYSKLQNADMDNAERFEICLEALNLYKGDLLKDTLHELRMMQESARFQNMYLECLKMGYKAAQATGNNVRMLNVLERATEMMPYDEEVAATYITCMADANETTRALTFYDNMTVRLMDDLGTKPSEGLSNAYAVLIDHLNEKPESVIDMRQKISEKKPDGGTFYCSVEVFCRIYWFISRQMERTGQSVFLMLCTLTDQNETKPKSGSRQKEITENFHIAINKTLRGSDVYTRYGPTQYLALLLEIDRENCDIVTKRLHDNFKKLPRMSKANLMCGYVSIMEVDRIFSDTE